MTAFIEHESLLSDDQHGFRSGKNTGSAHLSLNNKIIENFQDGSASLVLFLDFQRAFETLDRGLLLTKLERMGFRGKAQDLLRSYFQNRRQFTYVNGVFSPSVNCDIGTPQGSNFGPMCFALYLNDIFKLFDDSVGVVGYADDCAIIISGRDTDKLVSKMNEILARLTDWCDYNKLAINISKTKYMFVTNRVVMDYPICIRNES